MKYIILLTILLFIGGCSYVDKEKQERLFFACLAAAPDTPLSSNHTDQAAVITKCRFAAMDLATVNR